MGFSWSTVLVGDKATDGIFQELCDNLDTLYSNLELSAHSWVNIPTTGQNITATLVTEIRSVTDNADDQNKCRTHYADHDAAYQDGEKTTHWLNHNSNDQETHDSGIDITHDVGEDSAYDTGHDISEYTSRLDDNNIVHNNDEHTTDDNTYYISRLDNHNSIDDASEDIGYDSSEYSGRQNGVLTDYLYDYHSGHDSTAYTSVLSNHHSQDQSSNLVDDDQGEQSSHNEGDHYYYDTSRNFQDDSFQMATVYTIHDAGIGAP